MEMILQTTDQQQIDRNKFMSLKRYRLVLTFVALGTGLDSAIADWQLTANQVIAGQHMSSTNIVVREDC